MKLKRFIKKITPSHALHLYSKFIVDHRTSTLSKLSPSDAFNYVYRKKLWKQGNSLSGIGSEGRWAEEYVAFVVNYIVSTGARKVVDAGCGDFLVGSKIAPYCHSMIGLDISSEIISRNRAQFSEVTNVEFRLLNLMEDQIPKCDLLLVRQVLQHLSNQQIEMVLQNINKTQAGHVLISEHCQKSIPHAEFNIDLGSHSLATRVAQGSGVDIGLPPFSRPRHVVKEIEPGPEDGIEPNSALYIYELDRVECEF